MQWLTQFEHHVIANIHHRANGTQAAARQALHHPSWRRRLRIHAAHNAATVARTHCGRLHIDRQRLRMHDCNGCDSRRSQGTTRHRCDFARHTGDAQAIAAIRRKFEGKEFVVKCEIVAYRCAHGRIRGQQQQAGRFLGQA